MSRNFNPNDSDETNENAMSDEEPGPVRKIPVSGLTPMATNQSPVSGYGVKGEE